MITIILLNSKKVKTILDKTREKSLSTVKSQLFLFSGKNLQPLLSNSQFIICYLQELYDTPQISIGCHGRTAGYPTAPAQIPACGTTALGSSEILASVKDKLVLPSLLFPAGRFAFVIQSNSLANVILCRLRILSAPSST